MNKKDQPLWKSLFIFVVPLMLMVKTEVRQAYRVAGRPNMQSSRRLPSMLRR